MLGDNIRSQSPKNYPIHTTLFQTYLNQENRENSPIFVNSATAVTEDSYTYEQPDLADSHVLVDSYEPVTMCHRGNICTLSEN